MRCTITVANCQFFERVEVSEAGGVVLGRSDEATRFMPDIDLTICGGRDKGVSRRHAALAHAHGQMVLIDLHSVNGTFLNDQMVSPDRPLPLGAENVVRLGALEMKITLG